MDRSTFASQWSHMRAHWLPVTLRETKRRCSPANSDVENLRIPGA